MTFFANHRVNKGVLALTALALLALCSCKSGPAEKTSEQKTAAQPNSASTGNGGPGINLNCVMEHIQNPPEAFHYSFKKESSNPVNEEADITSQTIDGSFKNNSASNTFHGVKSDADSWRGAWSSLMGIGGMSSAVSLVRDSTATVRVGPEKVNGYDTVKYAIDTAGAAQSQQGLYESVLGKGGFEKGTAWVTDQGCPVKLILDSELHSNNGSPEKIHYEVAMVKK
ncbi:MAG: hypothetical protein WCG81_13440 [Candidatus Angelobacter sp.]